MRHGSVGRRDGHCWAGRRVCDARCLAMLGSLLASLPPSLLTQVFVVNAIALLVFHTVHSGHLRNYGLRDRHPHLVQTHLTVHELQNVPLLRAPCNFYPIFLSIFLDRATVHDKSISLCRIQNNFATSDTQTQTTFCFSIRFNLIRFFNSFFF